MSAHGRGSVVGRRVVSTTKATITSVDSLMQSNQRVMRCLHEFGRYVEK